MLSDRATASPRASRSILVADDDENDIHLLQRLLAEAGVANPVVTFRSGEQLVAFLKSFSLPQAAMLDRPCLLFLDVKMLGVDGFEVLRWARRHGELNWLTIVMLSGHANEAHARLAAQLGADQYLVKFPSPDLLHQLLHTKGGEVVH